MAADLSEKLETSKTPGFSAVYGCRGMWLTDVGLDLEPARAL
jgi:hypothetical protein